MFGALQDNLNTLMDLQNNVQNHFCLCFSERADRWCKEETGRAFHNCFLPGWRFEWLRGIREEKRSELTKRLFRRICQLLPSNCELHRRVNKLPADHWPLINTLSLDPSCWVLTRRGQYVPQILPHKRARTHCTTIPTHRNVQHVYFKCCFIGSLMWIATNLCLAQKQWKHANEMAKPSLGCVCSCLMSWELWLWSEHILQKYYMRFTKVCGMFCNEELQGSKFLHSRDRFLNELRSCIIISVPIFYRNYKTY